MSSDDDLSDGCFAQDGEALEDDEELKLFIMGEKALYTKPLTCHFTPLFARFPPQP